ncbi:MAG: hypothetical protein JWO07_148 [Candidatus Saccharibacteria bacterium]|nr:hypothetical protein [Candidatus Saccharibacteria bacterium]
MQRIKVSVGFKRLEVIILALIVLLAIVLRLWGFPYTPNGLNQDEISAGYESYSLLTTGADRWGNHLPAYFPSWGSGMNVLYSYLSVPVIALFGLTPLAVRFVAVVLGIASIPLFYVAVRHYYGRKLAMIAAFFLAVSQWHVLLSRWGLESNLLPFFILLGLVSFTAALRPSIKRPWILFAFVPFALALYAYGIGVIVVALFVVLLVVCNRKNIFTKATWKYWTGAAVIALIMATPFLLSQVKTYVVKAPMAIEHVLPFSIPSLASTRLSEVSGGNTLHENAKFVASGFDDGLAWNSVPGYKLFTPLMIVISGIGICYRLYIAYRSKGREVSPFLLWVIACIPLFLTIPLNINRSNALYLPLIVCLADGILVIARLFHRRLLSTVFIAVAAICVLVINIHALTVYFSPTYAEATSDNFNPTFSSALAKAHDRSAAGPLYVTDSLSLNYMQVLWYQKINPVEFQHSGSSFDHQQFENYYFSTASIPRGHDYTFLVRDNEATPCKTPQHVEHLQDWKIGQCSAS